MPAGDTQRTWFPEMIAALRREWNDAIPLTELSALSGHLDDLLHRIRSERNITSPIFTCPHCGFCAKAAEPRVTVRATILALGRFQIAPEATVKQIERAWAKYRKEHGLDLYGAASERTKVQACKHGSRSLGS
ncbi:MAG: hypothetical protein ACR2JB_11755 [Bryobacteraceae bacterium]